ncbi:BMP family lipoprotein [Nocardioides humi]|uniref:BMP family protein n=1 Tax=Nocardioides humi TaxID=449461 RepID=A0ABN2BFT6_9ACTN|nr:BMP family ABC transporter substrate-binding protein [Nocardioides humi]
MSISIHLRARSARRAPAAAAAALVGVAALAACGDPDSASGGDCGYAFVFEQPTASNTAQQTIQRGLELAEKDEGVDIDIVDGTGLAQVADNLRAAADKGCYEAIGTAFFAVGEIVTEVARDYPDQKFFILSGAAEGDNVYNYSPANEQGTYVAGAMSAAMSESGVLGVVLGDDSPPLKRFSAGFKAGAQSVDPSVEVLENAVGSFSDAAKAAAVARSQTTRGADVIYSAAGSNLEVYFQADDKGYQVVASDLSDYAAAKDRDPAVAFIAAEAADEEARFAIAQFVEGTATAGSNELGLADGVFSIPYITDDGTDDYQLPAHVVEAGKKAYDDVVSGKVDVPSA